MAKIKNKKFQTTNYNTSHTPTWCPGCGNFGIQAAFKEVLAELEIPTENIVTLWDVGCIGNGTNTLKSYAFHSLHGRALPVALGAKLANPDLKVFAFVGDGAMYGEGTNHFIHAARYNVDVNLIVANNKTFSLTTGQSSPTSEKGRVTKTTPFGEIKEPINPVALSVLAGASFVGRTVSFDLAHMKDVFKKAILHRGFSHVDVLQQCVTFNKVNDVKWYKDRIYDLKQKKDYQKSDRDLALKIARDENKIATGVIFEEKKKTYLEQLDQSFDIKSVDQKIVFKKSLLKDFL
jgi:2-oxoglutarate/2-oxoacid ferredoxin oxidoreductase subunit beta